MTQPRHNSANVLDLRRAPAGSVARQRTLRGSRRWRSEPELHEPAKPVRDWPALFRESGKFLVGLVTVSLILLAGGWAWRLVSRAHQVQATGAQAVSHIRNAGQALGQHRPDIAANDFQSAETAVARAQRQLSNLDGLHGSLVRHLPYVRSRVMSADHLLRAAHDLTQAGQAVSQSLTPTDLQQPAVSIDTSGLVQGSLGYIAPLLQHRPVFLTAVNRLLAAADEVSQVPSRDLPASYQPMSTTWDQLRPLIGGPQGRLRPVINLLLTLFASPEPKDELVIFQNDDELRATGGFAGTFLLVEFHNGSFKILDSPGNGPYALSEQIPHTIAPPQPLLALNSYWAFQDTNWFLDVPTSASMMLDFYRQARGFRPDGVILVTPQLIEDLLTITGPLRPDHYQVDITSANFVRATEEQVEFGYDKALNNPKQFLLDLIPTLVRRLATMSSTEALQAGLSVIKDADRQDLIFSSEDQAFEKNIQQLGWDGALARLSDDGLAVVDSNLGGGKTDRAIHEQIKLDVSDDGPLRRHVVTIIRQHAGSPTDPLTSATNKDFVRVYAPSGAQLVSIDGATIPDAELLFPPAANSKVPASLVKAEGQVLIDPLAGTRITHESGRTVFGAWSVIKPGESQTITVTYTTPQPTAIKSWSLLWQKQPGAPIRTWTIIYHAPKGRKIQSSTGGKISGGRTATFTSTSDTTQIFGVVF